MHPGYIVYLVSKGCYHGKNGTGTSDWEAAAVFSREAAITFCARHKQFDLTLGAIFVSITDIEAIK